jgi:TonB family protein
MMHRSSNESKSEGEANIAFTMRTTSDNEKLMRTSGGVLQGNAVKRVQPSYPAVAKAAGAQGPVQVQVTIGTDGHVVDATVISGHPLLRDAAIEAARQWQFKPTELSGAAVKVQGTLTFNFTLRDSKENETPTITNSVAGPGVPMALQIPKPVTETLGEQMFDGIKAVGTRSVTTIPAGQIGNERPLEITFERWYSPELQTVLLTRQSDPRFGENTFKLVNIVRSEPAKSLFEIPSDYTMSAEPTFNRRVLPPPPPNQ